MLILLSMIILRLHSVMLFDSSGSPYFILLALGFIDFCKSTELKSVM